MELIHRADSSFITLDDEALSQEIEEIQRYSLGNQLRTGLFGQDASVQTDVSELPLVKRLSEETAELVMGMETLKEDAASKVKLVEAHYETRLQQEAEDFYTSINCKVKALENHYEEKITVLRNSYRQQLSDAIEVIKASYKNNGMKYDDVVEAVPADKARVQDLLKELQEKESKIESLKEQLKEYEEQALLENSSEPADDPEKAWLRTENAKLNDIVDALHVEMEQMQHALEAKDQRLEDLALDISQLKSKAEDDTKALQKVVCENEKLKVQLDAEKEEGRKQKLAAERLAEQERHGAQEAKLNAQKAQRAAAQVELDSKDRALAEELEKLRNEEKSQKQHIDRLQKQIAMISRAWEKKFEILQQSFHAIKDEMFLRQSLQRQAAVLHQASVRYTVSFLSLLLYIRLNSLHTASG
uniref:Si:dkey-188g12.1 n=1 Tax=Astyanax mexicanus TaxID=7994 RepID=A0A8B9RM45_ASTMX